MSKENKVLKIKMPDLKDYLEKSLSSEVRPSVGVDEYGDLNITWTTAGGNYACGITLSSGPPNQTRWWYRQTHPDSSVTVTGNFIAGAKVFLDYLARVLRQLELEQRQQQATITTAKT